MKVIGLRHHEAIPLGPVRTLLSRNLLQLVNFNHRLTYTVFKPIVWTAAKPVTVHIDPDDLRPGYRYVIAANHQSMLDPFIVCASLPRAVWQRLRPYRYFAHNGLFRNILLRNFLLSLGSFPARPHHRYASGLDAAVSFLGHHQTVVIFPEGKRTPHKIAGKPGVSALASLRDVGVIPAHISWQRGRFGRRTFRLVIGRPLHDIGLTSDELLDHIYALPNNR
jgi:1-acyl-sn-glycerol-3-phosphate acyltransferase